MENDDLVITNAAIYPPIGIARLGNSTTDYFIGPEVPLQSPNASGLYKDSQGRVKRQAARFRLYGYNKSGKVVKELTADDADIVWTVHLVNKKASWYEFHGRFHLDQKNLRNNGIQADVSPDERTSLIIDPGPRQIAGKNKSGVIFDKGKFIEVEVPLGELKTDEKGRLLVLGGKGNSGSVKPGNLITNYANNDFWYDDTSDGTVTASVTLKKQADQIPVMGAWVLACPPKYAPEIHNIVNLYDAIDATVTEFDPTAETLFYRDIYPILDRASNYSWVNMMNYMGHRSKRGLTMTSKENLDIYADNSENAKIARQQLFSRLRMPHALADKAQQLAQANYTYMPQLSGDDGDKENGNPDTWLTLTVPQYLRMKKWAEGNFTKDKPIAYKTLEAYELAGQPDALTRGSLEPCVGGPFFPGIEMTFIAMDKTTFSSPFRINDQLFKPGDVMKMMALPWQADFNECNTHWWPAQRPDDVVTQDELEKVTDGFLHQNFASDSLDGANATFAELLGRREPWARGLQVNPETADDDTPMPGDNDMVKYWSELAFVTKQTASNGETVFVEQERNANAGMPLRNLFYSLLHLEDNIDCLPKARQFADECLLNGQKVSEDIENTDELFHFFEYSKSAFEARMMASYNSFVDELDGYSPANDATFKSYEDMVQRVIQFAPFNLTDGSWLRNINIPGPDDEVRALLFSIMQDERGNGNPSMNHANIYLDLCHEVGFYPPPVPSEAFANSNIFFDAAFTMPVFELAISQFTETYFPELLGMTLQLEWSVVETKPTIELFKFYGINPHFYVMHVGIDNAVNGHGRRAIDAVNLYLDNILSESGEAAMQVIWKRIWNGYVAFAYTGTLGSDLANSLSNPASLEDRMIKMIEDKKEFGSYNHNEKMLGPNRINDWFNDPEGFLSELQNAGYIIPGKPDQSKFFSLLKFEGGPMFRVFTDEEIQLWRDWILSLTATTGPAKPLPIEEQMVKLIETLKDQQVGEQQHATTLLKGKKAPDGKPVSWWFDQQPEEFMEALSDPSNGVIVRGNANDSRFVNQLISPANAMGQAFSAIIPGVNRTGKEIVIDWINNNCPIKQVISPMNLAARKLWLTSSQETRKMSKTKKIHGMGSIH